VAAVASALTEADLHHWRFLEDFAQEVERVFGQYPLHPSLADPQRQLSARNYLCLYLFGLFNPVVRTMRGLCQASHLERVQSEVCGSPVSLGSFSEIQHLIEPRLLEEVFSQLSGQLPVQPQDARLGQWQWLARDSSLFRALPRMAWALYGGGRAGAPNRAVRLHLSLNLLEDKPQVAAVRPGAQCERKVWREQWQRGQAYVGDRAFGQDYKLFGKLQEKGCVFVLRLRERQVVMNVLQELSVSPEDRAAGVQRQAWVRLGCRARHLSVRVRVVWIGTRDNSPLLLVTNLTPHQLPAHLVGQLYRWRWKIEMFFRWVKCILKCRHWLAESPAGTAIQIYLALIAALLLQLYTGRKPNQRMMELLQWHQLGMASAQELQRGLERERDRLLPRKA
jgi:hypothetical protein